MASPPATAGARARKLALLGEARQAAREGHALLIVVEGPAGIGKSWLARAFRAGRGPAGGEYEDQGEDRSAAQPDTPGWSPDSSRRAASASAAHAGATLPIGSDSCRDSCGAAVEVA